MSNTVVPVRPMVEPSPTVITRSDEQIAEDYDRTPKIHWCKIHTTRAQWEECSKGEGCISFCGLDMTGHESTKVQPKGYIDCAKCKEMVAW